MAGRVGVWVGRERWGFGLAYVCGWIGVSRSVYRVVWCEGACRGTRMQISLCEALVCVVPAVCT